VLGRAAIARTRIGYGDTSGQLIDLARLLGRCRFEIAARPVPTVRLV
jgi:hypothetical protein